MPPLFSRLPLLLVLLAVTAAGCATVPKPEDPGRGSVTAPHALPPGARAQAPEREQPPAAGTADRGNAWTPSIRPPHSAEMAVLQRLEDAYAEWRGTPYLFGGTTFDGVDCSGFIQRVYAEWFGIALSRSTDTQVREGRSVSVDALQPGDIVFFRTGRDQRHAGIYVGGGEFLHASTTRGVTVDPLTEGYFQRTYWTARRMLSPQQLTALAAAPARASRPSAPPQGNAYRPSPPAAQAADAARPRNGW